jgi:hypothetical protein
MTEYQTMHDPTFKESRKGIKLGSVWSLTLNLEHYLIVAEHKKQEEEGRISSSSYRSSDSVCKARKGGDCLLLFGA